MHLLAALVAGLAFGAGLTVSEMVNPVVVLGFLDIAGDWNPALLLVMVGALTVALPGYYLLKERRPLFADEHCLPERREVDGPLLAGALIFGIGWGLAGFCPGPAITVFGIEPATALVFVAAMTAGMELQKWLGARMGATD